MINPTTKIIIAGGRDFTQYNIFCYHCDQFIKGRYDVEIVSGGARGVDAMAKRYAREQGFIYSEFRADWDAHGKAAGPIRNGRMAEYAELLLAFWDGKSRGTKSMITQAEARGLIVKVIMYESEPRAVPIRRSGMLPRNN